VSARRPRVTLGVMRSLLVLCTLAGIARADKPADAFLSAYDKDPKAKAVAKDLFDSLGHVTGVGADEEMDGGYRGKIHLVPELPMGKYRQQLVWVASALTAIDTFFADIKGKPNYRWRDLTIHFVRSVGKRTPSAYAVNWSITHNVVGSLLTSERGVRETYFHELFHLNDFDHGDWSGKTLSADYKAIIKKCGTTGRRAVKCLTPFAPNDTKVRATGTFYAFQPNNGDSVHEYAAELAVRYYKEQLAIAMRGKLPARAFKCGPAENARAWKALVDEFFGGFDRVPACE
jgi:hypothetical protein